MKKSHRVAHENQRRGGFCYYYCTISNSIVKNSFSTIQVNPSRSTFQFPRFLPPVQLYIENISSPACCSFSTLLQSDEFPKMQPDYLKYNSDSPKILVKALRKHKRS